MRALVTGYPGAIGRPLVDDLLERGVEVVAIVRPKKSGRALEPKKGLSVVVADILDDDLLEKLSQYGSFDILFHLAGFVQYEERTPGEADRINVAGTRKMLEIASDIAERFVYTSTCYVGGKRVYLGENDLSSPRDGQNVYEKTKAEAEAEVLRYRGNSLVIRLSTVIGDSKTGEIERIGGFSGFAGSIYATAVRKKVWNYSQHPFLLGVNPGSTMNLVAREWAVKMIRNAAFSNIGGTVHIAHNDPVNMGWLFEETFRKGLALPVTHDRKIWSQSALYDDLRWMQTQEAISDSEAYFGHYILQDTRYGHDRIRLVPGYEPPPPVTAEVIAAQIKYMKRRFFSGTGPRPVRKAA